MNIYRTYHKEQYPFVENGNNISDTDAIMRISEYSGKRMIQENTFEVVFTEYRTKELLKKNESYLSRKNK